MSQTIAGVTDLGGGEIRGVLVQKSPLLKLQEPCEGAFGAAGQGGRPAGG